MSWRAFDAIGSVHQPAREYGAELHRIDRQFRRRMRFWLGVSIAVYVVSALAVVVLLSWQPAQAQVVNNIIVVTDDDAGDRAAPALPLGAVRWRGELTRAAYTTWGLDAPVAIFAAQVEQESGWRAGAVSRVGARGMAQFMPSTATWWCRINRLSECAPHNPRWALRALVGYDRWIWEQIGAVPGAEAMDPVSRMWGTLRAYNGGLGHWRAEARIAGSLDRLAVDAACGRARRHRSHCRENVGYPRVIFARQDRYAAWGGVVDIRASGGAR